MLSKLIVFAAFAVLSTGCRSAANHDGAEPKPPRSAAPAPPPPAPAPSLAILSPDADDIPAAGIPSALPQASSAAPSSAPALPSAAALPGAPARPSAPLPLSTEAQRSRTPRVVLVIGDSLSDPRAGGGRYLRPITEGCPGTPVDNRARGGFMVNQMRRRFESELSPQALARYTDLLVFGGVNDLYSDISASRTFEKITIDLTTMYRAGKAAGLRIIAITVAPWGGFERYFTPTRAAATRRLNDWIHSQRATGLIDVVVDAHALLSCGDPDRICPDYDRTKSDGLHFGPKGHERLGAALLDRAFPECKSGGTLPLRRPSER